MGKDELPEPTLPQDEDYSKFIDKDGSEWPWLPKWNRSSQNYWKQLEENPEPVFKEEYQAAKERLEKERGQLGNFELIGLRDIVKEVLAHSLKIHKLGKTRMGIFTPKEIIDRFNAQFNNLK